MNLKEAFRYQNKLQRLMEVGYKAPFDVNDSFAQVLQWHMEQGS